MKEIGFSFLKLIKESFLILLKPKEYFSTMPKVGGFIEPTIKAVIYVFIGQAVREIWLLQSDNQSNNEMDWGIIYYIFLLISPIMYLFSGGIIIQKISDFCEGNTNFETCIRVSSSLIIIILILDLFPFLHDTISAIIAIIIYLYGILLLYYALTITLEANNRKRAKIISFSLTAFLIFFAFFVRIVAKLLKLN